jgi:DtxR family Mn-dependent transcriptional regulator
MMKKLANKKLVLYKSYKPLKLTAKGKKEAGLIIRKHRLTEMFLVEIMGFGWEEVHDIAEQIEHINSNDFFEKMDKILGQPKFDPHGEPIPNKFGKIKEVRHIKLSKCNSGDNVKLVSLVDATDDFLKYLNKHKLKLGDKLLIETIEKYDASIKVKSESNKNLVLSKTVSENLLVEKL